MTRNPLFTLLLFLVLKEQFAGLGTSSLWLEALNDNLDQMTKLTHRLSSLSNVGNNLNGALSALSKGVEIPTSHEDLSYPSPEDKSSASSSIDMEKLMEMAMPLLNSFSKQ